MNRDEMARHLYVHAHDGDSSLDHRQAASHRLTRGNEWDLGLVTDDDVKDCYARADELLATGAVTS